MISAVNLERLKDSFHGKIAILRDDSRENGAAGNEKSKATPEMQPKWFYLKHKTCQKSRDPNSIEIGSNTHHILDTNPATHLRSPRSFAIQTRITNEQVFWNVALHGHKANYTVGLFLDFFEAESTNFRCEIR